MTSQMDLAMENLMNNTMNNKTKRCMTFLKRANKELKTLTTKQLTGIKITGRRERL